MYLNNHSAAQLLKAPDSRFVRDSRSLQTRYPESLRRQILIQHFNYTCTTTTNQETKIATNRNY